MTDGTKCFALSPIMKMEDCERLHAFLVDAQDGPIEIDCSAVERLGGLTAQMLTMASLCWPRKEQSARFVNPSPPFEEGVALLGLSDTLNLDQVLT